VYSNCGEPLADKRAAIWFNQNLVVAGIAVARYCAIIRGT
jgi:hypothetical protein